MKTIPRSSFPNRQRGSAFITVLLFSFLLLTLSASIIGWSMTERRLNSRSGLWLEARNAAEGVAEYGCYQVAHAFDTKMNPTFSSSGTDPVTFPSAMGTTLFSGSNVDTSSISLVAGTVRQVPSSGLYYIDPNDPNNKNDPMVGRYCYRRDVTILSQATVRPLSGGSPLTAYIEEKVSVRGAPLLAYAIFYSNNDLEFGETPQMDIYGPVHVNGNLFVGPAGSSPAPLSFHGPVTLSGSVFHAWRGTTSAAQEGGTAMSSSTAVNFSTDSSVSGNVTNMRTSGGVWNDSTMGADSSTNGLASLVALVTSARSASFAQFASQTWHGNLQTAAMDIHSYNPMGFGEVVAHNSTTNTDILATDPTADDAATVGTTGLGTGYGHGYGPHSLIEPSMALPATTDTYYTAKVAIEQQKFANNAGLYIKVASDGSFTLYGDPRSAPAGTPSANIGPNGGIKLGNAPANVIQYIPYTTTTSSGNTYVQKGMYDQHQSKGVNVVQIDMGKLKTMLADMAGSTTTAGNDLLAADNSTKWGLGTANTGFDQYTPGSTGWNGGVYVEISTASTTTHTGVFLANGTVSSGNSLLPDGTSTHPAPNGVTGLTLATNAPVYILGSLNTDGVVSTTGSSNNSALYPDDFPGTTIASSKETPVALAADAVTVLSGNYFATGAGTKLVPTTTMSSGSAYNSYTTAAPTVPSSGSVEIAAALITGTITTAPDSTGSQVYSGGVHNLPRFLENWSSNSNTVAIRGSMISMYSSRIATAGWSISYYSAPVRQWGYDQIFANGKFPPIIPRVTSYRRIDFTYLAGPTAYATELSGL